MWDDMGTGRGNKTDETAGGKVAMIMAITKIMCMKSAENGKKTH